MNMSTHFSRGRIMEFDARTHIWAHCSHCDADFPAPKSMAGGHANCPRCRRAVEVGGGTDVLYWTLMALGAAFVLGISGMLLFVAPAAGVAVFAIGALIMGLIYCFS